MPELTKETKFLKIKQTNKQHPKQDKPDESTQKEK